VVFILIFVHLAQINGCPNYPMCELPTAFFRKNLPTSKKMSDLNPVEKWFIYSYRIRLSITMKFLQCKSYKIKFYRAIPPLWFYCQQTSSPPVIVVIATTHVFQKLAQHCKTESCEIIGKCTTNGPTREVKYGKTIKVL
jgi:hypothetical protein